MPQAAAITSVKCLLALLEDQGGGVGEKEHGRDKEELTGGMGKSYRALEKTLAFTLQSASIRGLKYAWWHNSSLLHLYPFVSGMLLPSISDGLHF